jgi:hypothetical protein
MCILPQCGWQVCVAPPSLLSPTYTSTHPPCVVGSWAQEAGLNQTWGAEQVGHREAVSVKEWEVTSLPWNPRRVLLRCLDGTGSEDGQDQQQTRKQGAVLSQGASVGMHCCTHVIG